MGILFGLIAALSWGGGDFLITRVTRELGVRWTLLFIQTAGFVFIGGLIWLRADWPQVSASVWLWAAAVCLLNLVGTLSLYRAFTIGTLAIVSPISAGFAAVTAILALVSGEALAPLTLVGVAVVIIGVIVVARAPSDGTTTLAGVPEAALAAFGFGTFFWLLGDVNRELGVAWPVLIGRIEAILLAGILLLVHRRKVLPAFTPRMLWLVFGAGLLDTTAFVAYNTGVASGSFVSVVTALASIFSAVTVLLAWLILKEQLSRSQWVGVIGVLSGVLMVGI